MPQTSKKLGPNCFWVVSLFVLEYPIIGNMHAKILVFFFIDSSHHKLKNDQLVFIPRHMLVAGYYVFMLAVRVSAHPHFVCVQNNLSIYKRISFKFCICICTNNVPLGIVNGQISIIYHRVLAFVNVRKKWFLASSSFTYNLEYHDETSQKCSK